MLLVYKITIILPYGLSLIKEKHGLSHFTHIIKETLLCQ